MTNKDTQDAIVRFLKQNEGVGLKDAIKKLAAITELQPHSISRHLAEMDGRRIKKVREGRDSRLYTVEFWRRLQEQHLEMRTAHTVRLKRVLALFIGELPVVDHYGAQPAKDGIAPRVEQSPREEYDPRELLPCERDVLFEDLKDHLDQLELKTGSPVSVLWSGFKDQVLLLDLARDALWKKSVSWIERKSGLKVVDRWSDQGASDLFVRLLYGQCVALVSGETASLQHLRESRKAEIKPVGTFLEFWWGAEGLVRKEREKGDSPEGLKRKVMKVVMDAQAASETSEFVDLASALAREEKAAQEIRANLFRALTESQVFEVFPGVCKYVQTAA